MHDLQHGLFVSLEGGEGAGKTTLIQKLSELFTEQGYTVVCTREPGSTPLGEDIRALLLQGQDMHPLTELFLFLAARAQHIQTLVLPALKKGHLVLCDRFNDSTVVYQGIARGLGAKMVSELCLAACSSVVPQLTLLLDIPEEIGLARCDAAPDRIEKAGLSFHQLVREGFLSLAAEHPTRISVIDATLSPSDVFVAAKTRLEQCLI